ncbi:MAG: PEP-CTERM sorting domain-containing protein [Planctomycetota bacterium]
MQDISESVFSPSPAPGTIVIPPIQPDGGLTALPTTAATFALVGGVDFTAVGAGIVGSDFDLDNDGTFDSAASLPFTTVFDAFSLLDSEVDDIFATTPQFTARDFADELGGVTFDQAFDAVGGFSDGADGVFRFEDGTLAAFDANGTPPVAPAPAGPVEFDNFGATGFEEIAVINSDGDLQFANIPVDSDPVTDGDQPFTLTPGSVNNIPLPQTLGDVIPTPDPPAGIDLSDIIAFGEDAVEPTGELIAGTSFENETPTLVTVTEGELVAEGFILDVNGDADFNGDGDTDDLIAVPDLNGDGDTDDTFTLAFVEGATRSEPTFSGEPSPIIDPTTGLPSEEDSASGVVVDLTNSAADPEPQNFTGPDGGFGGADDVLFDTSGVVAILDSTSSSETAGDLGFDSVFIDTRDDGNETGSSAFDIADGGDFLGVTAFDVLGEDADDMTPGVQDGRDGTNVFQYNDTDGTIQTTFDEVDLSGVDQALFSFLLGVENTGFEGLDALSVTLDVTRGASADADTLSVLEIDGDLLSLIGDLTDTEGELGLVSFLIPEDVLTAQAVFAFDSSAGAEEIIIDDIRFTVADIGEFLAADFDQDGDVDEEDFVTFAGLFGALEAGLVADFDADGDVDEEDFVTFAGQFGLTSTPTSEFAASFNTFSGSLGLDFTASDFVAVPEPGTLALVGLSLLGLGRRGRNIRR